MTERAGTAIKFWGRGGIDEFAGLVLDAAAEGLLLLGDAAGDARCVARFLRDGFLFELRCCRANSSEKKNCSMVLLGLAVAPPQQSTPAFHHIVLT